MTTNKKRGFKVTIYKVEQLEAATVKVTKDAKSVRDRLHSLLVSVLKHFHDGKLSHDEATVHMNALAVASPYHSKHIGKWIQEMTPWQWSDETNAFFIHKDAKLMGKAFIAARDLPFFELSKTSGPKPMDIWEEIDRLIAKAEKHVEKPVENDVVDLKAVKALREVRKLHAA